MKRHFRRIHAHPKTRVASFYIRGVDETRARALIAPAVRSGVISGWGSDEGFVWFNGKPGGALRAVRDLLVDAGGTCVPWPR